MARFICAVLTCAFALAAQAQRPEPSLEQSPARVASAVARPADVGAIRWAASWAAAPLDYRQMPDTQGAVQSTQASADSLDGRTVRQRVFPTLGGKQVRIRFSNLFGQVPLRIASASVAQSTGGAAISQASLKPLRFGGQEAVTIEPGAERWSDALAFEAEPGQSVAVSFMPSGAAPFATVHHVPVGATWTTAGDAVARPNWRDAAPSLWNHIVTGLDVAGAPAARVVVAFGDSITEGAGAKDTDALPARYPDRLASRLREGPGRAGSFAVINAGISGNRLLADMIGDKGIERFDRDVLAQSGVTHVIVLIGINDIGFSLPEGGTPGQPLPSADQVSAGLQQLIDRAHARGVKIMLGTLAPFKGAAYWSEEKEARRQAVNRWIRGRQDVDAVVDFDRVLRDPRDPLALNPLYDSGDKLHPGNAGYAAMAGAIDLRELQE